MKRSDMPTACIELASINPEVVTHCPLEWDTKTRRFLNIYGKWFQAVPNKLHGIAEIKVYAMTIDGEYLKVGLPVSCKTRSAKWAMEALIDAGLTKEEIIAASCAARMGVKL